MNTNSDRQRTIAKEVSLEGIGLHTGNPSRITFRPSGEDTGLRFVRIDLPEKPVIPATHEQVNGTAIRGTTLGNDAARVHTVEHILATCSAFGIDNLEIQLTNNEPPVLDGSARPFVDLILSAGITEQKAPRRYLTLTKPVVYESGKTRLEAYPADEFSIDCTVNYDHPFLKEQRASFSITPDSFLKEISPARTFCFDYEIEALKSRGLARGGDLTNAIVVGLTGIHNPDKKLRYPDEFARHKLLDLIGDLSLIGAPLKARIVANRCGHNHNVNFVKELIKAAQAHTTTATEVKPMESAASINGTVLDINAIQKTIPHRYPFLMIDRVTIVEELKKAVGIKCVSGNEPFFQGHFPGQPLMPGVLIVEAMAQTSCVLFLSKPEYKNKLAVFMGIDAVKFRKPVIPGDVLELRVEVLRARERGGKVRGEAYVNNALVTEAEFMFAIVERGGAQ